MPQTPSYQGNIASNWRVLQGESQGSVRIVLDPPLPKAMAGQAGAKDAVRLARCRKHPAIRAILRVTGEFYKERAKGVYDLYSTEAKDAVRLARCRKIARIRCGTRR